LRLPAGALQDVRSIRGTGRIEAGADDGQNLGGELVFFAVGHRVMLSG
jgi:hypothetical protein